MIGHPSKRSSPPWNGKLLYDTFDKDQKRQLNQILLSAIISFLKRGTIEGGLELRIRGNGAIRKTWEDMKKGNLIVRTSGSLGSASRTRTKPKLKIWRNLAHSASKSSLCSQLLRLKGTITVQSN